MKPVLALLTLAGLALAAPVAAQQGQATTLDAIHVQAARVRGVDDFELPASASTSWLEGEGNGRQVQLSELLGAVPGLALRDRNNLAQDLQLSIRGFGARSSFGVRGVRLLLDGVPATMPDGQGQLSHFNPFGAERVEVLRGPFSALYGNSSGGVLQLWSGDGERGDPWRLRTSLGSHGSAGAAVQLRGRGELARYNVAASHFRSDGWREHSAARRDWLNARLGFEPGPGQRLDLLFNAFEGPDAQDPLGLTRAQWTADPRQADAAAHRFDTRKSVRQRQLALVHAWQGRAHSLQLMAYAGRREVEQFLAIPVATQANPLHAGGVIGLDGDHGGLDARWSWQGEWAGQPLQLTVGANADGQRQHRRGWENFEGEALGGRGRLRRDQHDQVHGLDQFVQAWWQFDPRASLLLGARHSRLHFRSRDHYVTAANPDDGGWRDYAATTPVAGLSWRVGEHWRVHLASGRGFETPTFNELGYRADGGAGLALDLAAARSRNHELGAKWRSPDGARLELALFESRTRDELAVARNSGGRSSYHNIGATRRRGAELGASLPLGGDGQLQLAWTWLQAQALQAYPTCTGLPAPCTVPANTVAAGTRLPGVPRQQLFLRWQAQPGPWQWAVETVANGDVPANDLGTAHAPGHALLHLEAARRWPGAQGPWRLFARIDNVLDRRHVGSVIVNDGNGRYYEPGPGRGYTVGLQWDWAR